MSKETYVGGDIIEWTGGNNLSYAKEEIINSSNKQVIQKGKEGGVIYGINQPPPSPPAIEIHWYDVNGKEILQTKNLKVLDTGNKSLKDYNFSSIRYGEKVKVKVKDASKKNQKANVMVCDSITNKAIYNMMVDLDGNGEKETEAFYIPLKDYDESKEMYDYTEHTTTVTKDVQYYYIKLDGAEYKKQAEILVPYTYRRNYEELIGLFKIDDTGEKDSIYNYESEFIGYDPEIKKAVEDFVKNIKENLTKDFLQSKTEIGDVAKTIWELAVKKNQHPSLTISPNTIVSGIGNIFDSQQKLDDRPLYWARIKMQAWLKRRPEIKESDIDFSTSQIKKGTQLKNIITLFEEQSRNYTGIDFSRAPVGSKKVLITGFDPFFLNSINHNKYKKDSNILQSNPSGVVALALANNSELGAYIQTIIVPVRYTDFDGSQDNDKGQGEGIIEKYIKEKINEVDMIITVSQAGPNEYHIDVFATATRKGLNDNMDFTRVDESKSVNDTAPETIKTTLPSQMTRGNSKAIYYGEYSQKDGTNGNATIDKIPTEKVYDGPGGNYLSNEIFYRVAKIRSEIKPNLKTGHFHISKIQGENEKLDSSKVQELLETVKHTLVEGFKTL